MMEHQEILHRCFRCGYCKLPGSYQDINCPSYQALRFETFSPGGRMWLLRAFLEGEIPASARLSEILFSCAACGNCTEQCVFPKFKSRLLDAFTAGRGELINAGAVPGAVKKVFESVYGYGNAFGLPRAERGKWAQGLGLEPYGGQEYLLYIGCEGSFDERAQQMARVAAGLLREWGVSFGVLGADEQADGNEIRAMGESALFEHLARQNIEAFGRLGVRKIITLSPHAYHAFKNHYPWLGAAFEVFHYSQVLQNLSSGKSYRPSSEPLEVTYHDPCYLGRHNKEYDASRLLIRSLPGVELREMDRSRADALCCGGGGGNFYTGILAGGADSPSRVRVREAADTGASRLVVACPTCAKMLDDAVRAEDLQDTLRVMDLAELIASRQ
jgi:Fe-S oxidoreductase